MSAHTPGPWSVIRPIHPEYSGSKFSITEPSGDPVASVHCNHPSLMEEEDANLIAAAPDLLAALDGCVGMLQAIAHAKDIGFECLEPAVAAIAKARGSK